ncbi:MAG: hypothetical protein A9183_07140 [Dehalococcoides mccartyi]|uniref:hypothetical protein n=1 Tax=Dehalococcoides mccartyi TaxID=61435 RepID=UPI000804FB5C|nr:hypothetical protein [Dehalococcoides mccartyi]OBW63489.1 MAG: hypothetical protein A9183_07140 [Dehalococcoides mccartyi]
MARIKKQESPIIRLTHWEEDISFEKKLFDGPPKDEKYTVYGVDAEGNERVYKQLSAKQWKRWSKTDPLWKAAHSAMIQRLLSDPSTRDTVILFNIEAALKKGDEKTALELANALSESTKAEIIAKPEG